jgi:hypothetical protein
MEPNVIAAFDKLVLRKRSTIETIDGRLKNIFIPEHSRHRPLTILMVNAAACLAACSCQEKKPSPNLRNQGLLPLTQ